MSEVRMPDGSVVDIPSFALESTQSKMHDLIRELVKNNSKSQEALEKINQHAAGAASSNKVTADQSFKEQQRQTKMLNDQIKNNSDFRTLLSDRLEADMTKMFVGTGNMLTGLAKGAAVASAAISGALLKSFMDLSSGLRELTTVGLGQDGIVNTITDFTALGMSAEQAAGYLTRFSNSAAVLGRSNFSKFTTGLAESAALSSALGLTFSESLDVIGEEIDIRRLGSTQRLNLDVAERSAIQERIQQTFALSAVTGKSIREIAASSSDFFKSNARVAGALLRLPAESAAQVRSGIDFGIRVGASVGDEFGELINNVFQGASAVIPTATQEFQDLIQVPALAEFSKEILSMNKAVSSGSLTQKQAQQRVIGLGESLLNMSDAQIAQLEIQAQTGNQTAALALNAIMQFRTMGAEGIKRMRAESVENDALIKSVTAAQNAFNKFKGIFGTVFFRAITGLTGPMEAFTSAMLESNDTVANGLPSVLGALKTTVDKIFNAIMTAFGVDLENAGNSVEGMAETIREKLVPWILKTGEQLEAWILKLKDMTAGEKIRSVLIDGFKLLFNSALTAAGMVLMQIFREHWPVILAGIGALMTASVAKSFVLAGVAKLASSGISKAGSMVASALNRVAQQISMSGGFGGGGGAGGRGRGRGRGGFGRGMGGMLGKASVGGLLVGTGAMLAANELENQGQYKAAAGVDVLGSTVGMASTGAMAGGAVGALFGGVGAAPGAAIGGAVGGVAGLGMGLYQNFDTFFGTATAQAAVKKKGVSAIDSVGDEALTQSVTAMQSMTAVGGLSVAQHYEDFFNSTTAKAAIRDQGITAIENVATMASLNFGAPMTTLARLVGMFSGAAPSPTNPAVTAPAATPVPKATETVSTKFLEVNSTTLARLSTKNNELLVDLGVQMTEMNMHLRNIKLTNRDIQTNTS